MSYVVDRGEEEDPKDVFVKIVCIGTCLARPDVIDLSDDQHKVVSATRVVFGGTSASDVRRSDGEVTMKVALGDLRVSSCSVKNSQVESSFSRTMSVYLRSL